VNPANHTEDGDEKENNCEEREDTFLSAECGLCCLHFLANLILAIDLEEKICHLFSGDLIFSSSFVPSLDGEAILCSGEEEVVLVVGEVGKIGKSIGIYPGCSNVVTFNIAICGIPCSFCWG